MAATAHLRRDSDDISLRRADPHRDSDDIWRQRAHFQRNRDALQAGCDGIEGIRDDFLSMRPHLLL